MRMGFIVAALLCVACGDVTGPQLHEQVVIEECDGTMVDYITIVMDLRVEPPTVKAITDSVVCVEFDR